MAFFHRFGSKLMVNFKLQRCIILIFLSEVLKVIVRNKSIIYTAQMVKSMNVLDGGELKPSVLKSQPAIDEISQLLHVNRINSDNTSGQEKNVLVLVIGRVDFDAN